MIRAFPRPWTSDGNNMSMPCPQESTHGAALALIPAARQEDEQEGRARRGLAKSRKCWCHAGAGGKYMKVVVIL